MSSKITDAGIKDIIVNVNPGEVGQMERAMEMDLSLARASPTLNNSVERGLACVGKRRSIERRAFSFWNNIILGSINKFVDRFQRENLDCMIALSHERPTALWCSEFHPDGTLKHTIENQKSPSFAVTGIYLFTKNI